MFCKESLRNRAKQIITSYGVIILLANLESVLLALIKFGLKLLILAEFVATAFQ
jgi:hypothetical protein